MVSPKPLFDMLDYLAEQAVSYQIMLAFAEQDFNYTKRFLLSYKGSEATFNAYRREVERLLQWSWHIAKKSIRDLRRSDIEVYLSFCQTPPLAWIGTKVKPRFLEKEGIRIPNPEWRPFVATVSKVEHRKGHVANPKTYMLSETALKEIFAILSSFFNFLIQENYIEVNPILLIRQKSRYIKRRQNKPKVRRLSKLQWRTVIETAERMADREPALHERTLFIVSALFGMYLRISELVASSRWTPKKMKI